MSINIIIGMIVLLTLIGLVLFLHGTAKLKQYLKLIGIAIIIAIPFAALNLGDSIYSNSINSTNIVTTTLFLVSWYVFGVIQGQRKNIFFIRFILGYWLANLLMLWLGNVLDFSLALFAFLNITPLYGIYYYITQLSHLKISIEY
ncbi:MAG: hypothetical protein M0Z31_11630 [Clostridia bacterium]|nr:hypothetical protein [Clostridia bacterium]